MLTPSTGGREFSASASMKQPLRQSIRLPALFAGVCRAQRARQLFEFAGFDDHRIGSRPHALLTEQIVPVAGEHHDHARRQALSKGTDQRHARAIIERKIQNKGIRCVLFRCAQHGGRGTGSTDTTHIRLIAEQHVERHRQIGIILADDDAQCRLVARIALAGRLRFDHQPIIARNLPVITFDRIMMTVMTAVRRCRLLAATASATLLLLAGCVHVPTIPDDVPTQNGAQIAVHDARGRLSQRETDALLKRLEAQAPDADELRRHLVVEQTLLGRPLYTGNLVTTLRDGPDAFAATFAAIHQAQRYLYLEYYILQDVQWNNEGLADLLIARAQQGVQIDVLYDALGSGATPAAFFDRLRSAGIHLRVFNPFDVTAPYSSLNSRDHRKILIADGQLAVMGGVNLSTDYQSIGSGSGGYPSGGGSTSGSAAPQGQGAEHELWHDTDLKIEGPAVHELERLFADHWKSQGGSEAELADVATDAQPRGDEVVRIVGSEHGKRVPRYYGALLASIRSASAQVWVTAAYFVPTFQERQALARAARRGVDVRLLLPSHSDSGPALAVQHSYYGRLLHAGVKIYERQDGILHSKTVITDGVWSVVGSSNFDNRSVLYNDEVDAIVLGHDTGAQLQGYFTEGLSHARQIDAAAWHERPFKAKLRERFWRIWEHWL
jgi:cardiolipin synthase